MKKVVGLLFMFKKDDDWKALLQVRGKFDYGKNCPEIWPGICQLTVTGMLEKDEDFKAGIIRETSEELGSKILTDYVRDNFEKFTILEEKEFKEKYVINYGFVVEESLIEKINWHKSAVGGKIVAKKDLYKLVDKNNFQIDKGVEDQENITAMYSDQIDALKNAFKILAI
jgi:hypothetical protein